MTVMEIPKAIQQCDHGPWKYWTCLYFGSSKSMYYYRTSQKFVRVCVCVCVCVCGYSWWCHDMEMLLAFLALFNTLMPRQNGRHFADDIFKCIFLNENLWIPLKISLTFIPKGPINNIPILVQVMAWRRPGDKPLSEPMVVNLLAHICVTRPQWVKGNPQEAVIQSFHDFFVISWNKLLNK